MDYREIYKIKKRLNATYTSYKFDVQYNQNTNQLSVNLFQNNAQIDQYTVPTTMPSNVFWDNIRTWMISIMQKFR